MYGISLIDLGQLAKPINTLVERSSDAVGGLFKPWQTRRMARADADAALVRAETEIQITDLHKQAFWRFLEEEAAKQTNMENILLKAIPSVDQENARPEDIERDWFTNYFDKCRIVSDEEMQELWARILGGQANSPGSFSKRTVNLMADLEKSDAELFHTLCGFGWQLSSETTCPLIFDSQADIYRQHGINFGSLGHLESLGLIRFNSLTGFIVSEQLKALTVGYFEEIVQLTLQKDSNNQINVGEVLLTHAGFEIARIINPKPVEGFLQYVQERWTNEGLMPTPHP